MSQCSSCSFHLLTNNNLCSGRTLCDQGLGVGWRSQRSSCSALLLTNNKHTYIYINTYNMQLNADHTQRNCLLRFLSLLINVCHLSTFMWRLSQQDIIFKITLFLKKILATSIARYLLKIHRNTLCLVDSFAIRPPIDCYILLQPAYRPRCVQWVFLY